ncbi:hypothetical protein EHYA_08797 [Embleya hyalina]|uniref:Uncharacterized protein n=1 Tax=Embleya hyalina TaxID=516124 RepID=A0A401Z2Q8_9ACTN|nr:hypothetical protein EHYA_08797 [Embleya hyalina]
MLEPVYGLAEDPRGVLGHLHRKLCFLHGGELRAGGLLQLGSFGGGKGPLDPEHENLALHRLAAPLRLLEAGGSSHRQPGAAPIRPCLSIRRINGPVRGWSWSTRTARQARNARTGHSSSSSWARMRVMLPRAVTSDLDTRMCTSRASVCRTSPVAVSTSSIPVSSSMLGSRPAGNACVAAFRFVGESTFAAGWLVLPWVPVSGLGGYVMDPITIGLLAAPQQRETRHHRRTPQNTRPQGGSGPRTPAATPYRHPETRKKPRLPYGASIHQRETHNSSHETTETPDHHHRADPRNPHHHNPKPPTHPMDSQPTQENPEQPSTHPTTATLRHNTPTTTPGTTATITTGEAK